MTLELCKNYLASKSLLATVLHMGIEQIVGLSVHGKGREGKAKE